MLKKIREFIYIEVLGWCGIAGIGYGTSLYSMPLAFVVVGIIFLTASILISFRTKA